jgi:hypothetical protein
MDLIKKVQEQANKITKLEDVLIKAEHYVNNSYEPDCKGDLMRFNELKKALSELGGSDE